ncbi:hypothetical protein GCK72_012143 [Caenorhabditis remanei]|uniref:SCP domain-containing protein n=1 Tax=Caenorhabditis remanei TaxID=31234 RepID=A0A6A5GM43_CAERE|nr:hypothetical protein GCK72_012143 [Caenorhabditis remanei]KAF1755693.1 hypothetical protein GCK72_012143 [Caenorhabditis remanei]
MKLFIAIGIFFIGSVAAMPEDDQEILVNQMNEAREKFAVLLPVANMNEIKYDASLERKVSSCDEVYQMTDYDHRAKLWAHLNMEKSPDGSSELMRTHEEAEGLLKAVSKDGVRNRQNLHPLYTGIACITLETPCPYPGGSRYTYEAMCFFGGTESENVKSMTGMIRGEAGTQCKHGNSEKWRHLCKVSEDSGSEAGFSVEKKSENLTSSVFYSAHLALIATIMVSLYF